ncbi:MAG: septum formation initiator family protein [Candidatus Omnitrophica bacterium]|nr:septum formation initiator family protein [Candidatus Omnitrophota bacterium]
MGKKKVIILAVSGLALLGFIFIPGYLKIKRLTRQNRELERQIEEIKQVNKGLGEEQERMKNDPLYLESIAREKLGVVKKGEVVFKVLPPQEKQ